MFKVLRHDPSGALIYKMVQSGIFTSLSVFPKSAHATVVFSPSAIANRASRARSITDKRDPPSSTLTVESEIDRNRLNQSSCTAPTVPKPLALLDSKRIASPTDSGPRKRRQYSAQDDAVTSQKPKSERKFTSKGQADKSQQGSHKTMQDTVSDRISDAGEQSSQSFFTSALQHSPPSLSTSHHGTEMQKPRRSNRKRKRTLKSMQEGI